MTRPNNGSAWNPPIKTGAKAPQDNASQISASHGVALGLFGSRGSRFLGNSWVKSGRSLKLRTSITSSANAINTASRLRLSTERRCHHRRHRSHERPPLDHSIT